MEAGSLARRDSRFPDHGSELPQCGGGPGPGVEAAIVRPAMLDGQRDLGLAEDLDQQEPRVCQRTHVRGDHGGRPPVRAALALDLRL